MASKILLQSYRSSISLFRPYLSIFQPKYFSTEKPSDLEIHTGAVSNFLIFIVMNIDHLFFFFFVEMG